MYKLDCFLSQYREVSRAMLLAVVSAAYIRFPACESQRLDYPIDFDSVGSNSHPRHSATASAIQLSAKYSRRIALPPPGLW